MLFINIIYVYSLFKKYIFFIIIQKSVNMSNNDKDKLNDSKNGNKKNVVKQFVLGKTIGEGTFGKVKIGTHILTGEKVAVKILEKSKIREVADVERVAREIHILKLLRHPNIIQLQEIIEDNEKLFLFIEQASGGELFDQIVKNQRLKEKEACKFLQHILNGVEQIHKLGIVHRDLKPENLLLDDKLNIKIVDFGLSNTYKEGEMLKTACGSPCQAAPEMVAGKTYHGLQVDIWSCGIILFAMICGFLPFEDPNTAALQKKILAGEQNCPKQVSIEGKDFLKNILNTDPTKRFTVEDIRKHTWQAQQKEVRVEGVIVGFNSVPIDFEVLKALEEFGFNLDYGQKCLEGNKHNHITTTYQLSLQKRIRQGYKSPCDPYSDNQDHMLIAPRPFSSIVHGIITKNKLEHIALLPRSQPREFGTRKQKEQRDTSTPVKVEQLPDLKNKANYLEFKKYSNVTTQLNSTQNPVKQPNTNREILNQSQNVPVSSQGQRANLTQLNVKKGGTFRATTASNNGGNTGRTTGVTGTIISPINSPGVILGGPQQLTQPQHQPKINSNNYTANAKKNQMNTTQYVTNGNKNILINVLNDKKSPRPPSNSQQINSGSGRKQTK